MKEKIVLGLSGGVDSAVAARLLQERYEVTGLYLDIGLGGTGAADAAAVAERLGIPFETADIRACVTLASEEAIRSIAPLFQLT